MAISQQFVRFCPASLLCLGLLFSLTACGGSDKIELAGNKNVESAIEAATGPLQDLNLRRAEIPPLLVKAAMNPYAREKKIKCDAIREEVTQLDELLGPDMQAQSFTLASSNGGLIDNLSNLDDAIDVPSSASLVSGAGNLVRDKVMGTIRAQTDILPFRSIIRKISGADKHSKRLAKAYEAGKLRRAYLKGLADVKFGDKCLIKPIVVEARAEANPFF